MRPASRGEDGYKKHVRPTHVRGEKTYARAAQTPTTTHTHHYSTRAAKRWRRARRRRQRRERCARRPCACCRVARRPCRAGSRAGGTCQVARGARRTTRGRRRVAAAAAGVGEPRPLEAAAAASARPAGGGARSVFEEVDMARLHPARGQRAARGSVRRARGEPPYPAEQRGVEHDVVQVEAASVAGVLGSGGRISANCAWIIACIICAFDETRTRHVGKSSAKRKTRENAPHTWHANFWRWKLCASDQYVRPAAPNRNEGSRSSESLSASLRRRS
jgi:hypothetical protein